jgi:hypothetical protein
LILHTLRRRLPLRNHVFAEQGVLAGALVSEAPINLPVRVLVNAAYPDISKTFSE